MRTGVILAGGRGERMGAFKPMLSFRGRPLVSYALDALRPLCNEILIMGGLRAAQLAPIAGGARVLRDPGEGPQVALPLAARVARHPTLLVAPADAPFLRARTYGPLLDAGQGMYVLDGVANPLVGVYARAMLAGFSGRSLQELDTPRHDGQAWRADLRDLDTVDDLADLAGR